MKLDLERHWYCSSLTFLTCCLLPLSWLFRFIVYVRRFLYRVNVKESVHFSVPVIVIGNITVGGTGKTPFVIALSELLRARGYIPGIVSRGAGGIRQQIPCWVDEASDVSLVGDEAVLLAKRTHCPVVICIDRVAAVKELLANTACNIVISDDGLQHYQLQRDIEIAIVDSMRGFGNQQLLPAGPLREPISRLKQVDFIIDNLILRAETIVSVKNPSKTIPLNQFKMGRIHAVAAIGNPKRFFEFLREKGFDVIEHPFPDHYLFKKTDLHFSDNFPVIMTEKDAVKCHLIADDRCWFIPVDVVMYEDTINKLNEKFDAIF